MLLQFRLKVSKCRQLCDHELDCPDCGIENNEYALFTKYLIM